MTADITKMYKQVLIDPSREYYGEYFSRSIQLAIKNTTEFSKFCEIIVRDFHVDDLYQYQDNIRDGNIGTIFRTGISGRFQSLLKKKEITKIL